jgi:dipeptidyl aminopeptidase/acylaminoacyl peptidase
MRYDAGSAARRVILVFVCGAGLLPGSGALAAPDAAAKSYTIEQLMSVTGYGGVSFSPDGKVLLVSSKKTGLENLYTVPVTGGPLTPVTRSTKETIGEIGYFPDDDRILYTSDQGGNELYHIYVRNPDGAVRDLTPGHRHKSQFVAWAPDGRDFYLVTNERDPRFFDLYRYDAKTYARRRIFDNDAAYQVEAVSPDGGLVALSRIVDNATTVAYLYDTRSKTMTPIVPATHGVTTVPRAFTPDGAAILYTTDRGAEFQYLVRRDLKTGIQRSIFKSRWDVDGASFSPGGGYLLVRTNHDARAVVHLLDPRTYKVLVLPETAPAAVVGMTVARDAPLAAMVLSDGDTPGDVFLLDLRTGKLRRFLDSLGGKVARHDLVRARHVRFKSYDGLPVPGLLYVPHGAKRGDRRPALIWVHGGPGWQSRVGFDPLIEYLVNHGYVCYQINNRGSIGDGKTFYHLDDRKHGDADLDDVVASKAMLVATGYVDPDRIVIAGESYGGYMVLAGLAFRPKAFAAGVDLFGVSNWPELLSHTPPWWTDLNRLLATEMGDYHTDGPYLRSISPYFHADRIRRPLLVLQGANDPRVKPVESQSIVEKVRANHVPVQYVVFPDEGHGFRKKANQIAAYKTIRAFLDRYARPRSADAKSRAPGNPLQMGR